MLRNTADRRTIAYLILAIGVSLFQWNLVKWGIPGPRITLLGTPIHLLLFPLSLFMGVATAVISHNHNHVSIWKSKRANLLTNYVISIYYGHPAIGWVPTHNMGHHKFNNRPGDSSISPRWFKSNHLLALLVYPTVTSLIQTREIRAYIGALRKRENRRQYWAAVSEYVVFFGFMAAVFVLDWRKALFYFLLPQQFALFTIQVFNYVQHIEADPESTWNHSRNFVSPILNALLFNNGYHTVHHMKPGLHWTLTPALHREVEANIHRDLKVQSWWGYMIWTFFLRPFVPGAKAPDLGTSEGALVPR